MTTEEYLDILDRRYGKGPLGIVRRMVDSVRIRLFNRKLIGRYPWLIPLGSEGKRYFYGWTSLDMMPSGWRRAFGDAMVEEIHQDLLRCHFEKDYRIIEIKEKYGGLRWCDGGTPLESRVHDIIGKYEDISFDTCIICGDRAELVSKGYILPYCIFCAIGEIRRQSLYFKGMGKSVEPLDIFYDRYARIEHLSTDTQVPDDGEKKE